MTTWTDFLQREQQKTYYAQLMRFVDEQYSRKNCFPAKVDIFKAFDLCPFDKIKVIILGQDPYHTAGKANGLAFSVQNGVVLPPSLRNIYKEIENDLGIAMPVTGDLTAWARQGVFLLNATLTVEESKAGSHQNQGWEVFSDALIAFLAQQKEGLVYLLWGAYAQKKAQLIDAQKNLILTAPHPSPLSAHRGFFGCAHFSQTNAYLTRQKKSVIDWSLQ